MLFTAMFIVPFFKNGSTLGFAKLAKQNFDERRKRLMNNKVILMGRLANEPDIKTYTNSNGEQSFRAAFSLAIDRNNGKDTDFLRCVAFGKTAEFAKEYLHKGMKMSVEGRLQSDTYEKDGQKIYSMNVVVQSMEFVESKEVNEQYAKKATESENNIKENEKDDYVSVEPEIENLPFHRPF